MTICNKTSSLDIANNIESLYFAIDETDVDAFYSLFIMKKVANYLNIQLHYFDEPSEANNLGGCYRIFLNQNQSSQKQWQDFGHELGHVLVHEGCQWGIPRLFRHYQEGQARKFALHFCVPSFLLKQLNTIDIHLLMKTFNVEQNFALQRIEMYKNELLDAL
ncbi:ImmA/IrrE family metallo-endopeptidase [Lentibacillus juripiscarius]|uniref:ImmA/IrrE family metallo-endopeptidase n=1 Tax=Lentibacillus juripiscarius TaxID=257446 RepID=A0ABW5V4T9_9BACI